MSRQQGMLAWIIAFKAFKAVTLTVLGIVLLTTRHSDPVDLFVRLALAVHIPLTSRLLDRVLEFLANLTVTRQTALAVTAFGYALLMGTEGIALYLRKPWARWFTIIATSSLIPVVTVRDRPAAPSHTCGRTGRQPRDRRVSVAAR